MRLPPSGLPFRPSAALALLVAACGVAEAPPLAHPLDLIEPGSASQPGGHRPNPAFVPERPRLDVQRRALSTEGEVIVIEGDSRFVTAGGADFGITEENQRAIAREVFTQYPDRFDTIAIFLSFLDANHRGTAYYQNISNEVAGIGRNTGNGRRGWGLPAEGRLSGFVNMNSLEMFGGLGSAGRARSGYHAVLAQELSHRWLMFFQFKDGTGNNSQALLGRQDAHWSPLVHAYASVQDGIAWRDNGDGTFTHLGSERGFAPLDLYGMGIYGPEQVEPFFYIVEAKLGGMDLDKDSRIPAGATISGRRIDVRVEQVVAAMGPRNPPKGTETPYYRAAFVLVTAPGQSRADWQPYLAAAQAAQASFPETWRDWTLHAGAMCTKVTAPCPEPKIELQHFEVKDGDDDLVGPGDTFDLHLSIRNDGLGTAENVKVWVEPITAGLTVSTATVTVAAVAEGGVSAVPMPFRVALGASLECGALVALRVRSKSQEGPRFENVLEMVIGNRTVAFDPLHEGNDWRIDPDRTDTAMRGRWENGTPEFASVLGVVTQPGADHTPGEGKAAFMTGPRLGRGFSDEDVDGGKTTLESPVFSIGGTRWPSLVFYAWRLATDFSNPAGPMPVPGADLVVSASNDGGETWVELSRLTDDTRAWTRHAVALAPKLAPTNRMKFRFEIEDRSMSGIVEAGIDDVEIIDVLAGCPVPEPEKPVEPPPAAKPPAERDSGCSAGPGESWAALLVLAWLLRRRR